MKRLLTIATVAAVITAPQVFAEVKVYGKADLSLQQLDDGTDEAWEVTSNSSRFGIKGKNALDAGLSAIYKYELQIDLDDNGNSSSDHLRARNQFVGIQGSFGEVIIGRNDTPLKKAPGKFDQFGDNTLGDIKQILPSIENREEGVVQYTSPKIADKVAVKIMLIPGEDAPSGNDGIADATSVSVSYKSGPLYLALALDSEVEAANLDSQLIAAGWKGSNYGVNLLINTSELDGAEDEEAVGVSGYFKTGQWKFKAQAVSTDNFDNTADDDRDQTGFGVDYSLGKSTVVGFYSITLDNGSSNESSNTGFHLVTKF